MSTKNDKTITLSDEALKIYKEWGHKKSENTSEAIVIKHKLDTGKAKLIESDTPFTPEEETIIRQWIKEEIKYLKEPF